MTRPFFSSVDKVEWLSAPITVGGVVEKGFGRGSRDLGCPTANLAGKLLDNVESANRDGVYIGFGRVEKRGPVVKMVANLGRNITYDDVTQRVLEAYLMHDYGCDFYGEHMRLCIIGYLRPEFRFKTIDQLIEHIRNDITVATKALDQPQATKLQDHPFLQFKP